jgi:hypothetical protein
MQLRQFGVCEAAFRSQLTTWISELRLRLQVAGFPAFQAVVHAVGAKANLVAALAHVAVLVALATRLFQIADTAAMFFRHGANVARNRAREKG